jgi:hypothetical protein
LYVYKNSNLFHNGACMVFFIPFNQLSNSCAYSG